MNWRQWLGLEPIQPPTPPTAPKLPIPDILTAPVLPDLTTINGFQLSDRCVNMIREFEHCFLDAYLDIAGVPTIGWGTIRINDKPVRLGMTITQEQADTLLMLEVRPYVVRLQYLVTVPIKQNQVDALADFMYNCGAGALAKSTLLRTINARQPVTADMFLRWNKIKDPQTKKLVPVRGLTRRRQAEYDLYRSLLWTMNSSQRRSISVS